MHEASIVPLGTPIHKKLTHSSSYAKTFTLIEKPRPSQTGTYEDPGPCRGTLPPSTVVLEAEFLFREDTHRSGGGGVTRRGEDTPTLTSMLLCMYLAEAVMQ